MTAPFDPEAEARRLFARDGFAAPHLTDLLDLALRSYEAGAASQQPTLKRLCDRAAAGEALYEALQKYQRENRLHHDADAARFELAEPALEAWKRGALSPSEPR